MPAPKSKFTSEKLFFLDDDSFQESIPESKSQIETVHIISQTLETAKNDENRAEQSKKRKFNSKTLRKDQMLEEFQKSRQHRNDLLKPITGVKCAEESPTHKFFDSMADIVSTFPEHKIAEMRMKVCNLVSEMELSIIAEKSKSISPLSNSCEPGFSRD